MSFNISGTWTNHNGFLIDQTTNQAYPLIEKSDMRAKSGVLAISTPLTHLALSTANIGFRVLRVISGYHFWKTDKEENGYNFKARAIETGKDALRAVAQPFAFIALEIVSLIGLFKPYDAMRAYFHIENLFYGRPLMAQLLNFVPIENPLENSRSDFLSQESEKPEEHENPFPDPINPDSDSVIDKVEEIDEPEVKAPPTLEQRIAEVIEEDKEKSPNIARVVNKCMRALAEHIIDSYQSGDFNTWLQEKKQAVQQQANRFPLERLQNPTILQYAAQQLVEQAIEESSPDAFERFDAVDSIKGAIADELNRKASALKIDPLEEFEEQYLPLAKLVKTLPDKPEEFLKKQQEIAEKYHQTFLAVFETTDTENDSLKEKINILEPLVMTLDDELREKILVNLLKVRLDRSKVEELFKYFEGNKSIVRCLSAFKKAQLFESIGNDLPNFVNLVNTALDVLGEAAITTPYQKYFHIQLRVLVEKAAENIHDPLQHVEFDLSNEEDAKLNRDLKETIERINKTFSLDIELKIKMKTEYDALSTALNTVFEDQAENIRDWIKSLPDTYDLKGFENWLLRDQFYQTVSVILTDRMPRNAEELYLYYLEQQAD
ncbi:hypothetical protein [Waddlia chondrophila]|uniref:Uncharacterized protein n=1 Tax=Waddlia chondrophila (strain ATCC VR-1470 / WSU 86-1044) TaxID=716544 RepID=D6YUA6_WADCW|nr:hypothetical protein [Waddlia chondrophila]ADI37717.1 hypothetical protein wcw_0343 [Waddlia chondrophila WSU 86-1044]